MIRRHPGCELVAGCDIRSKEADGSRGRFRLYTDIGDMLAAHPDVEVVCICTPNGLHASTGADALITGTT